MSFAKNLSSTAKANTLTFANAGIYVVCVDVLNGSNMISSGNLKFTVTPTLSSISVKTAAGKTVTTSAVTVNETSQQLVPTALDQFGTPMAMQPVISWQIVKQPTGVATSLVKTGNAVTANFKSPGAYTLRAQSGTLYFDAQINVIQTLTSFTIATFKV